MGPSSSSSHQSLSSTNVPSGCVRTCGSSSIQSLYPKSRTGPGTLFTYTSLATERSPSAAMLITVPPYDQPTTTTGGAAPRMAVLTSSASSSRPAVLERWEGRSGVMTTPPAPSTSSRTQRQSCGFPHRPCTNIAVPSVAAMRPL